MTDLNAPPPDSDEADDEDASRSESAKREERRIEIWGLYTEGIPVVQIAKLYKVSRRTIYNDIEEMKQRRRDKVRGTFASVDKQFEEIGENLDKLDLIFSHCMMDYSAARAAQDTAAKDKALNTALRALSKKSELQLATGLIPSASERKEVVLNKRVTFKDRLGSDSPLAALDNTPDARMFLDLAAKIIDFEKANPGVELSLDDIPEGDEDDKD